MIERAPAATGDSQRSPRGALMIAGNRSAQPFAGKVVAAYEKLDAQSRFTYLDALDKFSDTETVVQLAADVNGDDVFLFQSLYDPTSTRTIDENYMAFLIAARAFREWGANHVTAVLPYLAYARQDKPTPFKRQPTTAKLTAGIDRLVTWHPHLRQIHGFYGGTPVHVIDALGLFVDEFRRFEGRSDVVAVAPDAGASKFITHFGRALDLSCAIGSKYRPRPEEAIVSDVIGDISTQRIAIVLDDMISSGGTIEALVQQLAAEGIEEVYVGASHNLCLPIAHRRLQTLHDQHNLREVLVTNTIPQTEPFRELPFLRVHDLSATVAEVVYRIHYNQPISDLYYRLDGEWDG